MAGTKVSQLPFANDPSANDQNSPAKGNYLSLGLFADYVFQMFKVINT